MRHAHPLDAEGADLDRLALRVGLVQLRGAQEPVLVELRLDERERQLRAPDVPDRDAAEQVREPADVILVAVRQQHGADAVGVVRRYAEVRQDEVDAELLVAREREPGVDDDDVVAVLVDGHVLPHLAEPAERNDP